MQGAGKQVAVKCDGSSSSVLHCRRAVSFVTGKRTRDFAFVSLCYGRSGEEICTGYAMAASGRMQYDYKQINKHCRSSAEIYSTLLLAT